MIGVADGLRDFLGHAGVRTPASRLRGSAVALVVAASGAVYGGIMAAYGGFLGDRAWMVLYGAVKVPMLFVATMALAVPFFYVLNVLSGVAGAFPRVWRLLVDYQLAVAVQLAAVAPITLLVNVTEGDYRVAQSWSTFLFAIASWNAHLSLRRGYAALESEARIHRHLRRAWILLYAFVGVQMAWDLRPFVGNPDLPVTFFREEIGNAYAEVPRVLWEALR
jgi:hypothetical protein